MANAPTDVALDENKMLADEAEGGLAPAGADGQDEKDSKKLTLWQQRFKRAENFRNAHIDRMQRMYKIYRAYRDAVNYAYGTSIMPPVGFQIVETIKPRLASAQIDIVLSPTKMADADSEFIADWESLVSYDLSVIGPNESDFDDLKIWWINAMLIFGNGVLQLSWDGTKPYAELVDNYLMYWDPKATNRGLDSRWEIKQTFKDKAVIKKAEDARPDGQKLYDRKNEKGELIFDLVEDQPIKRDPRVDRAMINTLRMGNINDGAKKGQAVDAGPGTSEIDKNIGEKQVEIWECWDHVTDELVVIMNQQHVVRNEENPYLKIRGGRMFFDLPDISLNWEYYAMSHLEPVETTIYEMADSRNQAMDGIVFSLDPVTKVKKGKGYKPENFKYAPGAWWELDNVNDLVIETGPTISNEWVAKDNVLQASIQSALALSEYTQGIPNSSTEPGNKVELLLMQTNIRFSLLLRQMEIALADLVNAIIQMNQEFLDEDLEYRITGTKGASWKTFGTDAKQVQVDARVDIQPKVEKTAEQEANETVALYKALVTDEIPLMAKADQQELLDFKKRKRVMQKMLIRAFGKSEYLDEIMGADDTKTAPNPAEAENAGAAQEAAAAPAPEIPAPGPGTPSVSPALETQAPIPTIPVENGGTPNPQGPLATLLARFKR